MLRVGKLKNKIYDIGMRYYFIPIFVYIVTLFLPFQASAYELKMEPDISISENYISDENLYLAGLKTWFNATYEKDLVSVSLNQTIKGTIFGDVTLLGNHVSLEGEMFDDVRIIANTVYVSGVTNKDLVIIANNIFIDKSAIINGDSLMLGNVVTINGQYLGETQITANRISVGGEIVGPTTLTAQRLTFNTGSKIVSELSYFSPQRAILESDVEIQKPLNFNQIESIKQNDVVKRLFFGFVSFWAIIKLIATLFVIFILTQVFRLFSQRVSDIVDEKKSMIILNGIFSLLLIPLLVLVLFGSLVLIPVSVILALMFGIMVILLPAMSAIVTGQMYQRYILKREKTTIDFNMSALTLIILTFVGFIPYVGAIVVYLLYIVAFGAMTQYLYEQVRRKKLKL